MIYYDKVCGFAFLCTYFYVSFYLVDLELLPYKLL